MPGDGGKRGRLIEDESNASFNELLEPKKEEIVDGDDGVAEEFFLSRCISETRKRRLSSGYYRNKTSRPVDCDSYLGYDPDEFCQEKKIAHPKSRLSREDYPLCPSFPAVRGEPMMLYSDVRVEIVEDPDRPCSVQSDDSSDEDDTLPIHKSRTHQISLTEDLSNCFSSAISFAHQGSPRPGPSNRHTTTNKPSLPTLSSETNNRKRMISTETFDAKRWKSEEPPKIITASELGQPVIRKAYGYLVSSESPSYDALLSFYKQNITAKTGDRCYCYKHHSDFSYSN